MAWGIYIYQVYYIYGSCISYRSSRGNVYRSHRSENNVLANPGPRIDSMATACTCTDHSGLAGQLRGKDVQMVQLRENDLCDLRSDDLMYPTCQTEGAFVIKLNSRYLLKCMHIVEVKSEYTF